MADGAAYVRVQARTSLSSTWGVGSSGATTFSGTITWSFNGGISGRYGWDSPRKVNYVEGDVEATNAAVAAAYQGATLGVLFQIMNCVVFN